MFALAAGRGASQQSCEAVSLAAADIKEGKPAPGYWSSVVGVDIAP